MFYLYQGFNATTGTPNARTGRMSMYGDIIGFTSRLDRDEYYNTFRGASPSEYVEKCNKKTARDYCLGMDLATFDEYMQCVEVKS